MTNVSALSCSAVLLSVVVGCKSGAPAAGEEGGPCYGNATCNADLLCLSKLCVRYPDGRAANDAGVLDGAIDSAVADAAVDAELEIPDAIPFDCDSDRSLEPNDTLQTAWTTPIPARMDEVTMTGLAICPDTDVDIYRFGIDVAGKNLRATIHTDLSRGPLTVEILNSSGSAIATGSPTGADNVVEVRVPNMSVGTWYARVGATAGVTNNYSLEIKTCSGSPACLD